MKPIRYLEERIKKLRGHLEEYGKSQNLETLHDIRLEVKKIKSLLELTELSVKGFNGHKHFKPFRAIFRLAGQIREPDVFYKLLLRYEIVGLDDSVIPLSERQMIIANEMVEEIPFFIDAIRKTQKDIRQYLNEVRISHVKRYVRKKKRIIELKFNSTWDATTLHKTRKMIKGVIHMSAMMKNRKAKLDPFYNDIQDLIGIWHDKSMLLPILRKIKNPSLERIKLAKRDDLSRIRKMVARYYGT